MKYNIIKESTSNLMTTARPIFMAQPQHIITKFKFTAHVIQFV